MRGLGTRGGPEGRSFAVAVYMVAVEVPYSGISVITTDTITRHTIL